LEHEAAKRAKHEDSEAGGASLRGFRASWDSRNFVSSWSRLRTPTHFKHTRLITLVGNTVTAAPETATVSLHAPVRWSRCSTRQLLAGPAGSGGLMRPALRPAICQRRPIIAIVGDINGERT